MPFLKTFIKKSAFLRIMYHKTKFMSVLVKISPILATRYIYKKRFKKKLNLKDPQDYNEKLQWLKLYWQHPLVVQCADKYEVRNFVKERGCAEILNELYGVYEKVSAIDWDNLPQAFVMKTTNSWRTNIICENKNQLNKKEVSKTLNTWLKIDHGLRGAEIFYSKMKPRIICEKYLLPKNVYYPNEYKIFCFNGNPKLAQMIIKSKKGEAQLYYFDMEWNKLELLNYKTAGQPTPPQPVIFEKMLAYAKELSLGFPFVRVDFYENENAPILSEMTFTPHMGLTNFYSEKTLKMLGEWIELPEKCINPTAQP